MYFLAPSLKSGKYTIICWWALTCYMTFATVNSGQIGTLSEMISRRRKYFFLPLRISLINSIEQFLSSGRNIWPMSKFSIFQAYLELSKFCGVPPWTPCASSSSTQRSLSWLEARLLEAIVSQKGSWTAQPVQPTLQASRYEWCLAGNPLLRQALDLLILPSSCWMCPTSSSHCGHEISSSIIMII